ncbi:hypothetical protein [Rhizorhabdus wittichii]
MARIVADVRRRQAEAEQAAANRLLPSNRFTDALGKAYAAPLTFAGGVAGLANVAAARLAGDRRTTAVKHFIPLGLLALAGCDASPVRISNDTTQVVWMDILDRRFPRFAELQEITPGSGTATRYCWEKNDAILLATRQYLNPVAFDPKDFCDPDECDCEIPVSRMVKRMTPAFVAENRRQTCAGQGAFLTAEVRMQLCAPPAPSQ